MSSRKTARTKQPRPSPDEPNQAEINALVGLFNQGRYPNAAQHAQDMTMRYPRYGFGWALLGAVLKQTGQAVEALAAMRQAAALSPNVVEAHYNLGVTLDDLGRFDEAEACYRRAVQLAPELAEAHNNLGLTLHDLGRLDEAVACYRRALQIRPDYPEALNNMGLTLHDQGQQDEAISCYLRALHIQPDYAGAHYNLGHAFLALDRLAEAAASFSRALAAEPGHAEAHGNLAVIRHLQGRLDEAEVCCRKALAIKPDFAEALSNLGDILHDLGQPNEAEACCRKALEIKPNFAEALSNLGNSLQDQGRLEEAEASLRRALAIDRDCAEANLSMGMFCLAQGRYSEAWPYYEYRKRTKQFGRIQSPTYPCWEGEPLAGKSLLMVPEQGFGDYIQFVRYAPLLKERGLSRLTLFCSPALKDLFGTVQGVDAITTDLASTPVHDYWSFPLSLPQYFETTIATLPAAIPYLHAVPARAERWRDSVPEEGFKVGLIWKGSPGHKNDAKRSLPGLSTLRPLWAVRGATFVSLQKGAGEEEARSSPSSQPIIPLGSAIADFADAAAIMARLDLVISVDTAFAHLAGALGKPCWVLLPTTGTDWRWFLERTDSPWYPGVLRLFRQTRGEDWTGVVMRVVDALKEAVPPRAPLRPD